ncbi:MAG TPA: hypothetical protein VEB21_14410 [Terriglobales bacterium]|nr:hypothetical protein [Terriglobales bacterium]
MKIRITRNTMLDGKQVSVGDVVDALDRDAYYLVVNGKAVLYTEPEPTPEPEPKPEPRHKSARRS